MMHEDENALTLKSQRLEIANYAMEYYIACDKPIFWEDFAELTNLLVSMLENYCSTTKFHSFALCTYMLNALQTYFEENNKEYSAAESEIMLEKWYNENPIEFDKADENEWVSRCDLVDCIWHPLEMWKTWNWSAEIFVALLDLWDKYKEDIPEELRELTYQALYPHLVEIKKMKPIIDKANYEYGNKDITEECYNYELHEIEKDFEWLQGKSEEYSDRLGLYIRLQS